MIPFSPYNYYAEIKEIIDPDTFRLRVSLGLDSYQDITVRLVDVNGPEIRLTAGVTLAEKEFGLTLLAAMRGAMPAGTRVQIQTVKDRREKYGRYLAVIWHNGRSVNEWLADEVAMWFAAQP